MLLLKRIKSMQVLDLFRLDGRVALVTGAAGHIGQSIAKGLAEAGAYVILASRKEENLNALAEELLTKGLNASVVVMDVKNEDSVKRAFDHVAKTYGRLHILVNNAYEGVGGTIDTSSTESFMDTYEVAVIGAFRCTVAAKPLLKAVVPETGHASIINIASMYGIVSPDLRIYDSQEESNPPFYGAAKAGLIQLTRYAACEYAREGIRVNAISPGPFPKPAIRIQNPEFHARLCARVPLGRMGEPEELKGVVIFLASDASTFVTGTNVVVDGGWTVW